MKIRKTYHEINPELLYYEIRDFSLKQGISLGSSRMETYSSASDSSAFTSRGTMTFNVTDKEGKLKGECLSVHIVGSAKAETKLIVDIDEKLFPQAKITALQEDIDFIFGAYEAAEEE